MYQTHWDLERSPFPSGLDTRLFYEGDSQRESLARLRFLVGQRRRFGLVLGETGVGKSLLVRYFAEQSRQTEHHLVQIDPLGLSAREFYWRLGVELRASVRVEDDLVRLFRQLSDRLQENVLQRRQTILLLDDLDQAGPDLLSHVQRLLRTDAANAGWLCVLGSVNEQQLGRLSKPLQELIDLRIDLRAWDELDTIGYLQLALLEAGAERPLFDDEALSLLHQRASGIPRMVNRLADYALLTGAQQGVHLITADILHEASESLTQPSLA